MTEAGPLTGIRVVELAGIGPSQYGGMLLSDLGADVIRIDRPGPEPESETAGEILNRGRRSITLDLKDPADLAVAHRLLEGADVAIDPYRPGVVERLGLGPDVALAHNPRLVFARMTGWGQEGPLAHAAGHDINYISLAGALEPMGTDGEVPPVPLNLLADFGGGGMLLAFGVATALYERERSGQGQVLDVAMVDGVASLLAGIHHLRGIGQWTPGRGRNWVQGAAPWYRPYRTSDDAFVTVGPLESKFYVQLLCAVGLDPSAWPQWDTDHWPALERELATRFAQRTREQWQARLEGTDVCFAPVLTLDECAKHAHIAARQTYVRRDGVLQPAPVPRLGRTPGALGRRPPLRGEHSGEIRTELGLPTGGS